MSTVDTQAPANKRSIIEPSSAIAIGVALSFAIDYATGISVMVALTAGSFICPNITGKRRYLYAAALTLSVIILMNLIFHWPDFKAGFEAGFKAGR